MEVKSAQVCHTFRAIGGWLDLPLRQCHEIVDIAPLAWYVVTVATGLRGEAKLVVTPADTAIAIGSGSVEVLATPRVVALCEEASVRAMAGELPDGLTTVGIKVSIDHLQPVPVGATVFAEALLAKVDGRRLTFTVSARDDRGLVAVGKTVRVVVDVERFLSKCSAVGC